MRFQILVSFVLLFTASFSLQAQTAEETIEKDISTFMESTANGEFETVMDMTYPKLFTLVPREQMTQMMSSMMNNPEMKMSIQVKSMEKIYDPIVEGTETFRRIDYNSAMQMKLGDEMWEQRELMMSAMKASMAGADMTTDDDTQTILIDQISSMVAIQQEGETEWKYLQYQADQAMMLKALLPEVIIQKMFDNQ